MSYKNPRRVAAGKAAHERKKAAQDKADAPAMQVVMAIGFAVVVIGLLIQAA